MIVRQYRIILTLILLFSAANEALSQDTQNFDEAISSDMEEINEKLQYQLNKGKIEELIDLYLKDAFLLIPGKTYNGNNEIRDYWQKFENPVEWEIEIVKVDNDEREIYDNAYYKALESKPAGWRQRGIELDEDKPLIYQFGRLNIKVVGEDGKIKSSEADNIKVWQVQSDGTFRILLDSYSWN